VTKVERTLMPLSGSLMPMSGYCVPSPQSNLSPSGYLTVCCPPNTENRASPESPIAGVGPLPTLVSRATTTSRPLVSTRGLTIGWPRRST